MLAGFVADPHSELLNASAMAWALRRALQLAIATGVVALVFATTLSGEGAERLATTAYLAAIFAAVAIVIQRFLPQSREAKTRPEHPFPAFLGFFCGVAALLGIVAGFAALPGAEALAVVAGFLIVVVAGLARSGGVVAFNAAIVHGGITVAATRYAVLIGMCALALTALLPPDVARGVAAFAYRLIVVAAVLIAASLIAPTRAGLLIRRRWAGLAQGLDRLAVLFRKERAASYAAAIAVAALITASFFSGSSAEPFAIAAYAAAAVATLVVAVECRRLRG
ncbi:MAG TPA: hypothetical protein VN909_06440 [Candidatus Dormibacteraeota bacterium]|nr:hypothetical protein [Candidatus Dormibacteraeota bacterium]